MDQNVEELLFRAYRLCRQVHLTFVTGRDRALFLHMIYGVIAGLFKELDRAAALGHAGLRADRYLEAACGRAERYFKRAAATARAAALPRWDGGWADRHRRGRRSC